MYHRHKLLDVMKLFKKTAQHIKKEIYFSDGAASHKNDRILHITPT
jgi:hypothetical protein